METKISEYVKPVVMLTKNSKIVSLWLPIKKIEFIRKNKISLRLLVENTLDKLMKK